MEILGGSSFVPCEKLSTKGDLCVRSLQHPGKHRNQIGVWDGPQPKRRSLKRAITDWWGYTVPTGE